MRGDIEKKNLPFYSFHHIAANFKFRVNLETIIKKESKYGQNYQKPKFSKIISLDWTMENYITDKQSHGYNSKTQFWI